MGDEIGGAGVLEGEPEAGLSESVEGEAGADGDGGGLEPEAGVDALVHEAGVAAAERLHLQVPLLRPVRQRPLVRRRRLLPLRLRLRLTLPSLPRLPLLPALPLFTALGILPALRVLARRPASTSNGTTKLAKRRQARSHPFWRPLEAHPQRCRVWEGAKRWRLLSLQKTLFARNPAKLFICTHFGEIAHAKELKAQVNFC